MRRCFLPGKNSVFDVVYQKKEGKSLKNSQVKLVILNYISTFAPRSGVIRE